jgi:hypothetical protein
MNHFSNAYQQKKEKSYHQKYTMEFVEHIQAQEPWQEKYLNKDFISHQPKMTAKK